MGTGGVGRGAEIVSNCLPRPLGGGGRGEAGARGEGTASPRRISSAMRSMMGVHCSHREGGGVARGVATACAGSVLDKRKGRGSGKRPTPGRGVILDARPRAHTARGCGRQRCPPRTRRRHGAAGAVWPRARVPSRAGGLRFAGRAHHPGGDTAANGGAAVGGRGHQSRKLCQAARQRARRPRSASPGWAISHPPRPAGLELSARDEGRLGPPTLVVALAQAPPLAGNADGDAGLPRRPCHSRGTRRRLPAEEGTRVDRTKRTIV